MIYESAILENVWAFLAAFMCSDRRLEKDLPVFPIYVDRQS